MFAIDELENTNLEPSPLILTYLFGKLDIPEIEMLAVLGSLIVPFSTLAKELKLAVAPKVIIPVAVSATFDLKKLDVIKLLDVNVFLA